MTPRRLYRSRDRQLAGVAGGMADYLDIDPTVVRILWILAGVFSGGLMLLAYIILAFVIPETPYAATTPTQGWAAPAGSGAPTWGPAATGAPAWNADWAARAAAEERSRERARGRGPGAAVIVGTILIVFGAIALADSLLPGWVGAAVFGPALVIGLGAALLVAAVRRTDVPATAGPAAAAAAGTASASTPEAGLVPAPAAAQAAGPAPATTAYDADATASVDLGSPADHVDPQPGTDLR